MGQINNLRCCQQDLFDSKDKVGTFTEFTQATEKCIAYLFIFTYRYVVLLFALQNANNEVQK